MRQEAHVRPGPAGCSAPRSLGDHEKCRAFVLTERKLLAALRRGAGSRPHILLPRRHAGAALPLHDGGAAVSRGLRLSARPVPSPSSPAPSTPSPCLIRASSAPSATRGLRCCWPLTNSHGPSGPSPTRIRRRIAAMSVADEFHVHIFPEDFPVNIANPANLRQLRRGVPGPRQVSIVVGSDVVANASSYRKPPQPDSIHTFDHVIFRRTEPDAAPADYTLHHRPCAGADAAAPAGGDQLHPHPRGGGRQPRRLQSHRPHGSGVHLPPGACTCGNPRISRCCGRRIWPSCPAPGRRVGRSSCCARSSPDDGGPSAGASAAPAATSCCCCADGDQRPCAGRGVATAAWTPSTCLPGWTSAALSGRASGRMPAAGRCWSAACSFPGGDRQLDFGQLLLTEVLTTALGREYTYALYCPLEGAGAGCGASAELQLQGFVPVQHREGCDVLGVDMRCPIVLSRNVEHGHQSPPSARRRGCRPPSPRPTAACRAC